MRSLKVVLAVSMIVIAVGCGKKHEEKGKEAVVNEKPASSQLVLVLAGQPTKFEEVSHYRDDKMDGYAFYVTNANMQDIESFCEQKQGELCRQRKSLKMYFFDKREKTPDISEEFVFDRASDNYCVADYSYDSQIGLFELTSHKKMPDGPSGQELPIASPRYRLP